jgi:hypothetical protein
MYMYRQKSIHQINSHHNPIIFRIFYKFIDLFIVWQLESCDILLRKGYLIFLQLKGNN